MLMILKFLGQNR